MNLFLGSGLAAGVAGVVACALGARRAPAQDEPAPGPPLRLLFWDQQDLHDTYGKIVFGAEPLRRDEDAVGYPPMQGPLVLGGVMRFYLHVRPEIASLPAGRLFYVSCRANGEFSTDAFTMPANGLFLDFSAIYPRPDDPIYNQAYVMVEVLDDKGTVIPGFERGGCALMNMDEREFGLKWGDADPRSLAGRTVRLRFYLRDAKIYGVSGR